MFNHQAGHAAPHRDCNHPDGRADQLRHHILSYQDTRLESESDIEIVSSVELGNRLRLMREKAKNKRMKNPLLSAQDSLHDEVACLCTYNGSITKRSSVGDENRPTEKMATETPENF